MTVKEKPLEEIVRELPPDLRAEVRDFAEFLVAKHARRARRTLRQDWAGALRAHGQQETSVELQHKALDWRGD
jgi:hypothetical protein